MSSRPGRSLGRFIGGLWRRGSQLRHHRRSVLTHLYAIVASGMIIGAAALYLKHDTETAALAQVRIMAEQANVDLSRALVNSLRDRNPGELDPFSAGTALSWRQVQALHDTVMATIDGLPIIRVRIFSRRGRILYSSDFSNVGQERSGSAEFETARAGAVRSRIVRRSDVYNFDAARPNKDFLTSYIPVTDGEQVIGVFESHYDISGPLALADTHIRDGVGVLLSCLLAIYLLLILVGIHSLRVLRRQDRRTDEMARAMARAEAANQAKTAFLANMSHEFRTPLNAILGFSEIIKDEHFGPVFNPAYRRYAADIHGSGAHLLEVVNEILDYTKIEFGSAPLELATVPIGAIIETVERMIERQASMAGVRFEVVADRAARLHSDQKKIRQILLNLLSNATKFTSAGGTVTLTAAAGAAGVAWSVADTGVGIAETDIATALAPFGQIESTLARRHHGTGLGLPLAKRLTETLGGRFELDSTPGVGTVVRFDTPDMRPEGGAAPVAARSWSLASGD